MSARVASPSDQTSPRTALVVEGGAMRGVFSAGVLDVFLEQKFDPFDLYIGTSAGACNLASHIAGQHGRNKRCYLQLMTQRHFLNGRRALRGGHFMDLDWLWDELARVEPLDVAGVIAKNKELYAVTTSAKTGQPCYLRPTFETMFDVLKASCALPILYRKPIEIDGEPYVDGGVSDPIAAHAAYRMGARRIVVIRSRPARVFKRPSMSDSLQAALLMRSRAVALAVRDATSRYRGAVEFMIHPPADCQIIQVAPETTLPVSRTTQDLSALEKSYQIGREQALETLRGWEKLG